MSTALFEDWDHAKYSNHLDDVDMKYSPNGGHIVVVARKAGVPVCWQCGEPFVQHDAKLGEVEKHVDGGPVPIYVHRRCYAGTSKKSFHFLMKGLATRRAIADIVKKTSSIFGGSE